MTALYSHETYFKEEVIEEIKLSIFSADASCSQHNGKIVANGRIHRSVIKDLIENYGNPEVVSK